MFQTDRQTEIKKTLQGGMVSLKDEHGEFGGGRGALKEGQGEFFGGRGALRGVLLGAGWHSERRGGKEGEGMVAPQID